MNSSSPRGAKENSAELGIRIDVNSYAYVEGVLHKLLYEDQC